MRDSLFSSTYPNSGRVEVFRDNVMGYAFSIFPEAIHVISVTYHHTSRDCNFSLRLSLSSVSGTTLNPSRKSKRESSPVSDETNQSSSRDSYRSPFGPKFALDSDLLKCGGDCFISVGSSERTEVRGVWSRTSRDPFFGSAMMTSDAQSKPSGDG
jgi:hypothetical protein